MRLIEVLKVEADRQGRPLAEVMAECLAGSLMSDDSDPHHVHWLTFYDLLENYMHAYNR